MNGNSFWTKWIAFMEPNDKKSQGIALALFIRPSILSLSIRRSCLITQLSVAGKFLGHHMHNWCVIGRGFLCHNGCHAKPVFGHRRQIG